MKEGVRKMQEDGGARGAARRVRAADPRALRVRGRAIEADGDPVPHAGVDSPTRSAKVQIFPTTRRRCVSVTVPRPWCAGATSDCMGGMPARSPSAPWP